MLVSVYEKNAHDELDKEKRKGFVTFRFDQSAKETHCESPSRTEFTTTPVIPVQKESVKGKGCKQRVRLIYLRNKFGVERQKGKRKASITLKK